MRRPSAALALSVAALVLAVVALAIAVRDGDTAAPEARSADRPAGLWRGLPTDEDLPSGWRVVVGGVGGFGPIGGATAQLQGADRLSGYLILSLHEDGPDGAHLHLRDLRESADVLPGRRRVEVRRLGNEAVAVQQQYQATGPGGGGPEIQSVAVIWRRGELVVELSIQDFGAYLGPGRTQSATPIDLATVEELAQAIDTRLERELR